MSAPPLRPDRKEIASTLALLFQAGDVVEIRIPKTGRTGTVSGYFDDFDALAKVLGTPNGRYPGVYVTLNPVNPSLLARAKNRLQERAQTATADKDIVRRRLLLVDCDAVRPVGISSTDAEHEAALARARQIRFDLAEAGFPPPLYCDSGNGGHLLYLIDLPNNEATTALVKQVLAVLANRYNDAVVEIDQAVFNAARVSKVYGTVVRKGDNTADRPHRLARKIDIPQVFKAVSGEQLVELARPLSDKPPRAPSSSTGRFDLDTFAAQYLGAYKSVPYQGGRKLLLEQCPINPDHHEDAAVYEYADGTLGFKCFHNSCKDKHWKDVRELFEGPRQVDRSASPPPRDEDVPPPGRGERPEANVTVHSPEPEPPPEPEESSSALSLFPEIAWRGIFGEYRDAMQGTTEAADAAHFCTLWAATAAILGRTIEMHAGDRIYPNVYLAVFGESGDKKTTAERRISHCNLFEYWPHIQLVQGVGSTEGLADELQKSETGICLFYWEEFSTFLSQARWAGSTLLGFFTECFDCPPEWDKRYRKKPIHLETPTPSILTATTPEWFWRNARAEDFLGGFGNRVLFFTGERKALLPNPGVVDGEVIARIKEHLKTVASNSGGRAHWTTEANRAWVDFYLRFEKTKRSGLLQAAVKRAHVYVRKLAMTYARLEQTFPHIDEDQLEAAIAVVEHAVASTEQLLDLQAAGNKPQAALEDRFLRYIAQHKNERIRRLQQKMSRYCGDAETFNRVLKNLLLADRIEIVSERRVRLCE